MPECHYGASRIVATLDDGSEFRDVIVAWGKEIVRVGSSTVVSFDSRRIVAVRHQK